MRSALLLGLLLLSACAGAPQGAQDVLVFADMPYCRNPADVAACQRREAETHRLVRAMNRTGVRTAVFLGDTKASQEACTENLLVTRAAQVFGAFDGALVYTPGDNEWTDCERPNSPPGTLLPMAAIARLREAFFSQERSLGAAPIPLERQARSGLGAENARWQDGQAIFATLNIPGVFAGRPPFTGAAEPMAQLREANLAWIDAAFDAARQRGLPLLVLLFQADMWHPCLTTAGAALGNGCVGLPYGQPGGVLRADNAYDYAATLRRIRDQAGRFQGRILMVHGDSHTWLLDPAPGDGAGGTIPNATRFMTPGEDDIRAVRIRLAPGAAEPFAFDPVR